MTDVDHHILLSVNLLLSYSFVKSNALLVIKIIVVYPFLCGKQAVHAFLDSVTHFSHLYLCRHWWLLAHLQQSS